MSGSPEQAGAGAPLPTIIEAGAPHAEHHAAYMLGASATLLTNGNTLLSYPSDRAHVVKIRAALYAPVPETVIPPVE